MPAAKIGTVHVFHPLVTFPLLSLPMRRRLSAGRSKVACHLAICLVTAITFCAPGMVHAQSQSTTVSATLQGSVRDSGGRPVAGATIHLQAKDGPQIVSARSDATGSYHLSGLREGIYVLRVEKTGYRQVSINPCVIGPNEAKRVDLTLEAPNVSQAQSATPNKSGAGSPEFYDEPQFTVAGVTDGTNLGGHGSNTVVRTRESLAKDVVTLGLSAEKSQVTGPLTATNSSAPAQPIPPLQDQAAQHHLRGDIAEKSGDSLAAVREYQKAAELDPSEPNFCD